MFCEIINKINYNLCLEYWKIREKISNWKLAELVKKYLHILMAYASSEKVFFTAQLLVQGEQVCPKNTGKCIIYFCTKIKSSDLKITTSFTYLYMY